MALTLAIVGKLLGTSGLLMQMRPLLFHTKKNLLGNVSCLGRETNKRPDGNKQTKIAEERSMPGTRGAHSVVGSEDRQGLAGTAGAEGGGEAGRRRGRQGRLQLTGQQRDKDTEDMAVSTGHSELWSSSTGTGRPGR